MVRKHYELDDSLIEFIPYRPSSMSHLKFTKEYDSESITKFYNQIISLMPKVPRKRNRKAEPAPQILRANPIGINQGSDLAKMPVAEKVRHRTVDIQKQLIRTITEFHWSDGTVEKEDRTHPVRHTMTVYG